MNTSYITTKEINESKAIKNRLPILWKSPYISALPDMNKTKSIMQKRIAKNGKKISYFDNEILKHKNMEYINSNKINYLLNRINKIKKQNKDLYSRIRNNTCTTI